MNPAVSVIITVHNEGDEVRQTVNSILSNTQVPMELMIIDDASSDGCCDDLAGDRTRVIRHENRVGVAPSRDEATQAARGEVFVFLDGHQRVSRRCIDHLATVATRRNAITWPDVCALHDRAPTAHGASFALCDTRGYFTATWNIRPPRRSVTRISSLRAPGYAIPRTLYRQVRWPSKLGGWGGSEAAISLKAFFTNVPIFHLCGPRTRHLFKKKFQYRVGDKTVWRNQAIIARVCFEDRSWHEYWYPEVFQGNLNSSIENELESSDLIAEQREFNSAKQRGDKQFWQELLQRQVPKELSRTRHRAAIE